ncbi:MAG: hypothetical protein U9N59_02465 [Campylobacterota bacterium]|nr:hypothetical protein [Campylobacterota bacterium]
MKKFDVIYFILEKRVSNIILLSIMFSSLIVIFMVGIGIKNVFYDYLRSDYGNIPDLKIQINDLNNKQTDNLIADIKKEFSNSHIDTLTGYEFKKKVSIVDSEELLLSNGLNLFFKGIRFDDTVALQIDNRPIKLKVSDISYQDDLFIKLHLDGLHIEDTNSIRFLSLGKEIPYGFCYDNIIEDDTLILQAKQCKDKIDNLLEILANKEGEKISVEMDGNVFSTKIIYSDIGYKSLVLQAHDTKQAKNISLGYGNIEIDNSKIESFDIEGGEIIINFFQDSSMEKEYKLFLSKILKDFINYKRMVLKLKIHTFKNDDEDDKQDKQLVYLNELTDLIDMIFSKDMGNLAISSSFLAQDLNNFGVLDNFIIKLDDDELNINIRSTVEYNPEKNYDKNILILNQNILDELLNKKDKNNYIDIYSLDIQSASNINKIEKIVTQYDKNSKILLQEDIIPSIKPKKYLFDISVITIAIFILLILFIAMYIVLRQFYSNFNSELSLLKLYGSKVKYQAFVNFVSFLLASVLIYIFMIQQEQIINNIMLEYFFIEYTIDIVDYLISIMILFMYIVINYFLESYEIKKLNLIKGQ